VGRGRIANKILARAMKLITTSILVGIVVSLSFTCTNPIGDILGTPEFRIYFGTSELISESELDLGAVLAGSDSDIFTLSIENSGKSA